MTVVAGAVLTGGHSRRMGRDKALLDLDGRPMARVVLDALAEAGVAPCVMVGGDTAHLAALGAELVPDRAPGEGPLGGVLTALEHFAGVADHVLVVACDLPEVGHGALRPLLDRLEDGDMRAPIDVVAAAGTPGAIQPMCALWATSVVPGLRMLFERGERSMFGALDGLRVDAVAVPPGSLRNVNTPDDLGG